MSDSNRATWNFLADTYWYVTQPDLPALRFDPGDNALSWQSDQTVWHISGYRNGYFWGVCSALLTDPGAEGGTPQLRSLVGTVTADGALQISFVRDGALRDSVITGFGRLLQWDGEWACQMQMTAAASGGQTLHWANMRQTRPGDPSWDQLPGTGYSVPDMLEGASYPQFSTDQAA
ncbi:hypothetical protein KIF53_05550 [Chromobacterium subtsugae]|uniref:DUF1349 domain-containing protein n=1 Tax=Chromobacterium subtsugae TaxID=251747 RepID=A0ABS7FAT6_9NEIS|nr:MULTISPECIES: hypothetical protein [Chromobacterium]KUM05649.1 hypothetical protein Cv017_07795 [Chromobacterium subtsugae]KZE87184.1 hypothetical protein AWB61_12620 [Chromobacterium sp. F49]MBW7565868.1 hypothetical protein [Chromobacterium subtsugae]MBW8287092.1 hypothetical protein [Chromobacterium subtsugae]WSE93169.1 hypothetical protein U6115_07960 [Chromobacterium subtsugae]